MTPLVSIILPVFNGASWITASIQSVLAQTFIDFELIIVNDGSTDQTEDIVTHLLSIDNRIVLLSQENQGFISALNFGLSKALGTFIARIDSDDLWCATKLFKQIAYLNSHPEVGLLGCSHHLIDETSTLTGTYRVPCAHKTLVDNMYHGKLFFSHSSVLFRSKLIFQSGIYSTQAGSAADLDLWLRFSQRTHLASLAEPLVFIRKHKDQMTAPHQYKLFIRNHYIVTLSNFIMSKYDHLDFSLILPLVTEIVDQNLSLSSSFQRFTLMSTFARFLHLLRMGKFYLLFLSFFQLMYFLNPRSVFLLLQFHFVGDKTTFFLFKLFKTRLPVV